MRINKYTILIFLFVAGCASSQVDNAKTVADKFEMIVFSDGISVDEAKTIAQRQVVKKNVAGLYDMPNPKVAEDVEELPHYQDYWFISFEEKAPASIPFIFMVLIDKQTGKVKYADDFNEGNLWILEAALLR